MEKTANVCSITGETYYGFGNNAYPFYGRCGDWANNYYVLPARLMGITREVLDEQTEGMTTRKKNKVLKDFIDTYFKEHKDSSFVKQFDEMWAVHQQIAAEHGTERALGMIYTKEVIDNS